MMELCHELNELLGLTKQYLIQEYLQSDRVFASPDNYQYFFDYAKQQKTATPVNSKNSIAVVEKLYPIVQDPTPNTNHPPKNLPQFTKPTEKSNINLKASVNNKPDKPSTPPDLPPLQKTPIPKKTFFTLEENVVYTNTDIQVMRNIVQELLPTLKIFDSIPDDSTALKLSNLWKEQKENPEVIILSFDEIPAHQTLLSNMAQAIRTTFKCQTSVISSSKIDRNLGWDILLHDKLKLVIGVDAGINSMPELIKFHREVPKQAKHFLKNTPLLLLSDIAFYISEPTLKISLWKAIREIL